MGGGGSGKTTDERQSVEELKTLLLSEAEMVFSTLSSTQQKIFKDSAIRAPFHTVLIDEAGQASEVAALQPPDCRRQVNCPRWRPTAASCHHQVRSSEGR